MIHLVFYKKHESLREVISNFRFSESTEYTQYFIRDIRQIQQISDEADGDILLFYFTEHVLEDDKSAIQEITASYPQISICLLSNPKFALEAWSMNILHFEAYPVKGEGLLFAYHKWLRRLFSEEQGKELSIRTDEGVHKFLYKDIVYLQAAGNYTMIHYGKDKCLVVTRQLGTFEGLCQEDKRFMRVHRSIILNISAIRQCKSGFVLFRSSVKPLAVSQMLESKIKKIILQS